MINTITLENLNAETISLSGKHLIEASAGTGKTYNITRIYLRLLLERELTVEQILLMTFTKDATQELRGRIDSFIREALSDWEDLCEHDSYFETLNQRIDKTKREFLLKRALLFLDEAAIYTIHGFCQRVLNQYAFTSGLPFNVNMAANSSEVTLQVCQDWYRQLAKLDHDSFLLLAKFWSTPESFLSSFSKAISHSSSLSVVDVESIKSDFTSLARLAEQNLQDNNDLLETALILKKKGAEDERRAELQALKLWLARIYNKEITLTELGNDKEKMPDSFIDGKRYGRSVHKAELLDVFAPVKAIKEQVKKIADKIDKANAYRIVKDGIYTIREKVIEQKQALNMLDFDDLINTLANCLNAEKNTANANFSDDELSNNINESRLAKQLLAQYPVALIDEFQDTDPKQFGILQAIYYGDMAIEAGAGLFLIGDPKQAIYGFRGGDIFAYLNARTGCDKHWLMDTNWRSTPDMIAGYNQLFSYQNNEDNTASAFGFGIPYLPVLAGKTSDKKLDVSSEDSDKALQFVHFSDPSGEKSKVTQGTRGVLAQWCANEISMLLTPEVADNNLINHKQVKPRDIAILVRDGGEARDIKHALQQAGLDSVFMSDRANLFHSQQAKQLLGLLKGILFPENERLFVAALSCGLLGFDAKKLESIQLDEIAYQSLKFSFVDYRTQWQRQGFITMAINLMHNSFDIPVENKDRCLTNVLHLFEILQAASVKLSQGHELLHWFEQQCHLETNEVEAELRLESDGDLIRIITQHGSKGLEYPYVFIPFACRHKDPLRFGNKSVSYLEYHNQEGKLCLSLDGSAEAKLAMSNEAYAESIRLLYVAITRAERRCYVLTTDFDAYHLSPLGKVLNMQSGDSIVDHLTALKSRAEHAIGIRQFSFDDTFNDSLKEKVQGQTKSTHHLNLATDKDKSLLTGMGVSQFNGNIERDWWLSSFSALSRNIRHAGVSNPDRDIEVTNSQAVIDNNSQQICFKLAKGAHTGNLLHDILEHTDFTMPNWQSSLEKPLINYGELTTHDNVVFTPDDLIDWINRVIQSPLVNDSHELCCLADIAVNKTLRESEFYFPMQGQGTQALANLLTDHRKTAQRELRDISDSNNEADINTTLQHPVMLPTYKKLSGMMHGFIDLVFEYQGKYYVCDYKSSHLGERFEDYQFEALLDNVEQNYYDLQYLIYSLALHRYLQQNLDDYDISEHFGGVYYLYLRGMTTDPQNKGTGVYYRMISEQEIKKLDALFSPVNETTHVNPVVET